MSVRSPEPRMYRQGDVLLIPAGIPKEAKWKARDGARVVLAYGEVTGHAHAIAEPGVALLVRPAEGWESERTFLKVPTGATLRHEEHAPIDVAAGEYEVRRQRQYDPSSERGGWDYVGD
jgi:hypothetical protein